MVKLQVHGRDPTLDQLKVHGSMEMEFLAHGQWERIDYLALGLGQGLTKKMVSLEGTKCLTLNIFELVTREWTSYCQVLKKMTGKLLINSLATGNFSRKILKASRSI